MVRSLILLQTPGAAIDLRPILSTGAWRVQHVDKLSALAIELPADPCPAAVAVIDDVARFAPGELSSMLANSQCEWLAIATREVTNDKRFAMLFAQYFFDFHTLPIDARQLLFSLGHAFGKAMMRERLSSEAMSVRGRFGMVGTSASMQAMYRVLEKVARADAPLLISGESGTGKELAALAIHRESARRDGRFVAVNCGAIPTTLMLLPETVALRFEIATMRVSQLCVIVVLLEFIHDCAFAPSMAAFLPPSAFLLESL